MGNCSTCDLTLRDETDPTCSSMKPGIRKKDPFLMNQGDNEKIPGDNFVGKNFESSVIDTWRKEGELSKIYTEEGESFIFTAKDNVRPAPNVKGDYKKTKKVPQTKESLLSEADFPINQYLKILDKMPSIKNETVRRILKENGRFNKKGDTYMKLQTNSSKFPPLELENGIIYFGHWRDKQKQGFGRQLWPDGTFYEGFWDSDLANGFGRLIHSDGTYYEGEWLHDKAHGKGTVHMKDGSSYSGDWFDDKPHGSGIEIRPGESFYDGSFFMGMKHGKGKLSLNDFATYEGGFQNNLFDGKGTYKLKDGSKYVGDWKEGKKEGRGIWQFEDGVRYEGEFHNDKIEGQGRLYNLDNTVFSGNFKDGKPIGQGVLTDANCKQTK